MSSLVAVRKRLREIYGENCENITKADIREATQLKADAAKGVEYAIPFAQHIAVEIGLSGSAVQVGPPKTLPRMFEKAVGKQVEIDEIPDIGRLRVLLEGPVNVHGLRREFSAGRHGQFRPFHADNRVEVTKVEDFYWTPSKTGRVGYHVDTDVTISGGKSVGIEIQFVDEKMLETEKASHLNYQKACAIERAAIREGRFYLDGKGVMQPNLTLEEQKAVNFYRDSNKMMYLADALNYGYYNLRRPDLQTDVHTYPRLIA